jgi:RNA polymerase sigma-70 factor, ECF subfamily
VTDYRELSESALLMACVEGDANAFGEVVRRYRDRLWAVALRTLGDPEEAADAVQDGLLNAYRAVLAGRFRGDAALTTWLHRVVVNACLDRVRRRQARPLTADGVDEVVDALPDARADADVAGDAANRLDVAAALATLPIEQRVAVVLVDMQGLPVREVALVLGVAEGTIKSRCARGRARLLPVLSPGRREGTSGQLRASHPARPSVSGAQGSGPSKGGGGCET